jgi:hypothetical protein
MRHWPALLVLFAALLLGASSVRAGEGAWRILKPEWTEADEKGFGDFVRAIAESGCTTTMECMRGPGNPYRATDPQNLDFRMDCAKWVYTLRAYYAWKNGLPFGYVSAIAGQGSDIRFSENGNRAIARRDLVDRGAGVPVATSLSQLRESVYSATYRLDAGDSAGPLSDFYSPKIQRGSIRAGTVIYDIHGHVAIVYDIEPDGRIRYMGADPDNTLIRSVYGAQFGQGPMALGGGFKNFRPLKLVGAALRGRYYVGGHIVPVPDAGIADFSLEQYRGLGPDAQGDGPNASFQYQNAPADLFEYVRGTLSGGTYRFDPVYELKEDMDGLCHDLQDRSIYVATAIEAGMNKRPSPAFLPGNIYASDDEDWEAYASPARDASLRSKFVQMTLDLAKYVLRAQARGDDYRAIWTLKGQLQQAYDDRAAACRITYTNSAGEPVSFGFDDAVKRLFAMSFDPYQCVERRWGASSEAELSSCRDDEAKTRWYEAEQNLRNQVDRNYVARAKFTLSDLEKGAPGSGTRKPPPADVAAVIGKIGRGPILAAMEPVGF